MTFCMLLITVLHFIRDGSYEMETRRVHPRVPLAYKLSQEDGLVGQGGHGLYPAIEVCTTEELLDVHAAKRVCVSDPQD